MVSCGCARSRSAAAPPDVAQLVLPLGSRTALRREDFIAADSNREAVAFLDAFPDWPVSAAALHGPALSGKSHLARAWAERAGGLVVAASELEASDVERAVPVAVEDAEAADAARQALIFTLLERGTPVLLTSRAMPRDWPAQSLDLATRYRALLAFALGAPDDALLERLARKLFQDRQVAVPDAVIAQMLRSLERSPVAIRDFVARADDKALAEKRAISPGLVRELLGV
jgi:chromosomal replication initiation ATPase DnaA